MKITVLGGGGWGTALSLLLRENGHDVTVWCYLPEEAAGMERTRENPLLPGVVLPKDVKFVSSFDTVPESDLVVFVTPSYATRTTARNVKGLLKPGTVLVSASKGIEKGTSCRLSEVIAQEAGDTCPVAVLSGPSHAEEVGRGVPTAVVSASRDQSAAELVQDVFMNERFRVYATPDVVGVEICAALKNVIALCAGVCTGLGCGDNTRAMLMTRGLTEIARLCVAMGGKRETCAGLSGVGDLIVTCTSLHSRNNRCGMLIGQGVPVQEAIRKIGAVVEGYYAAETARTLARRTGVEMPISEAAYQVLYHGADVHGVIGELMTRSKKREIEDSWV